MRKLLLLLLIIFLSGVQVGKAQNTITSITSIQKDLAFCESYMRNNPDSALYYVRHALNQLNQNKIDSLLARSYFLYGNLQYEIGEYSKCDSLYEISESYIKLSSNFHLYAQLEFAKGKLQIKIGNNDKGVSHYLTAKKLFSRLKDSIKVDEIDYAIAIMYFEKDDFKKAIPTFNRLLKKYPIDEEDRFDLTSTFAFVHYFEKNYDSAIYYFNNALYYLEKQKNLDGVAVTYSNIGQMYLAKDDLKTALNYFEKSLSVYQSINSLHGEAFARKSIGTTYYKLNNKAEAIKQLNLSFDLCKRLGLKQFAASAANALSYIYEADRNYQKALEAYKMYFAYTDSVKGESAEKNIEELQTKYNFERKETEIDLLKRENDLSAVQLKINEEEKNKRRYIFNFLLIIFILVAIGLVIIAKAYQNNRRKNNLLQLKNIEIAQQNKEIKDSINYAKNIQEAILPPGSMVDKLFPNSFVYYLPKDIVSGDFYWCEENENYKFIAAVDCTGHGVPGAFMSIVAFNGLSQAVKLQKLEHPNEILEYLNTYVKSMLRQQNQQSLLQDGMDIALLAVNKKTNEVEFSGANNPLLYIRNKELYEVLPDKQPVGNFSGIEQKPFTLKKLKLEVNDVLYLFSDGFSDQFGGEKGKKYKYARFRSFLQSLEEFSIPDQVKKINTEFQQWKGQLEQLDDVCVIGIKF